ncbi:MAG: SUF system Fe-S cluster assembly regulator [Anaeromyxobacteraceae bacterium]
MSRLTDYAIVLLAHLARSEGTLTAQELSARSRVPQPTVSKLAKALSRAGLVTSTRGRRGGYGLARPAEQISVAEIVEALEGPIGFTDCSTPGHAACDIEQTCPAKASWDPVTRAVHGALAGLSLAALAPYRAGDGTTAAGEAAAPSPTDPPLVRIGAPS